MLHNLLLLLNGLVALSLLIAILLQRQDTSGGGIMGGNTGAASVTRNPLAKPTSWLGATFMGTSLLLAGLSMGGGASTSLFDEAAAPTMDSVEGIVTDIPMNIPPVPMPEAQ